MPVPANPPAIVAPAQDQQPLMSEMIKRAVAGQPPQSPTSGTLPSTTSSIPPVLADLAGDASDIISTNWGLRHGDRELNPMLSSNPTKNALGQIAGDVGIQLLIHKLNQNHPNIAKALGYGHGLFGLGGTMYTAAHTHAIPAIQRSGTPPQPGNTYNGALDPTAPEINLK